MKKINLRGISEILCEKELKNVIGGEEYYAMDDDFDEKKPCEGKKPGDSCSYTWRGTRKFGTCSKPQPGIMQYDVFCAGPGIKPALYMGPETVDTFLIAH